MKDPGLPPDHFRLDKILSKETLFDECDRVHVEGGLREGTLFRSVESGRLTLTLPLRKTDLSKFNCISIKASNLSPSVLLAGMRLIHGCKPQGSDNPDESLSGGREELDLGGPRELRFLRESFGSYGFPKGWSDVRHIELTLGRERTYEGSETIAVELISLDGEIGDVPRGPRLTPKGLASVSTANCPVPVRLPPYSPDNPALFIPPPHSYPREHAEDILRGRIMGQALGRPIPWDANPVGALEWTHFLNRHHFMRSLVRALAETGHERYACCLDEMISSWIRRNPAPVGSNGGAGPAWETLSAAWRLREWLWIAGVAWSHPAFQPSTRRAMLCSLWEHARHLSDHKGHPNNWIIVESAALALAGLCFPRFKEAERWAESGLERLASEFHRQFFSDGVHFEISPMYHSICLDALLEVKEAARAREIELPSEFGGPLEKCASYLAALCRPDFTWPALNDSNGVAGDYTAILGRSGRVFRRPDFQWIGSRGSAGNPPETCSKAFPDAGIAVMRSDFSREGNFLVFRAGPSGAAHVHDDALSLDVAASGTTALVDPGITGYAPGELAGYYRSPFSHTMLLIDGEGPQRVGQPFHERITPAGDCFSWTVSGGVEIATGRYRGIWGRGISAYDVFRSVIFAHGCYWVVRDVIRGSGFHEVSACWQFMPGRVEVDENSLAVSFMGERGKGLQLMPVLSPLTRNSKSFRARPDLSPPLVGSGLAPDSIRGVRGGGSTDKGSEAGRAPRQYISGRLRLDLAEGALGPPRGWISLNGRDVPATHCAYTFSGELPLTAIWLLAPSAELRSPRIEARRTDGEDGSITLEIAFPGEHTHVLHLGPPPDKFDAAEDNALHGSVELITRDR